MRSIPMPILSNSWVRFGARLPLSKQQVCRLTESLISTFEHSTDRLKRIEGGRMQTLIITGLSGAGKTQAIQILEDADYYCVDNVPFYLVPTFIELCNKGESEIANLALVTDIRGLFRGEKQSEIVFRGKPAGIKVIFLEADESALVTRYQTTRRKHPLSEQAGSLSKSIETEKQILKPLRDDADWVIDTTNYTVKDLRRAIKKVIQHEEKNEKIQLTFSSFGYKYGMPITADYVFDTRFLPNPFYKAELREKTGLDAEVRDYVMSSDASEKFLAETKQLIATVIPEYAGVGKSHVEIAFGCTGGRHRSVTFALLISEAFKSMGYDVRVEHRELEAAGR